MSGRIDEIVEKNLAPALKLFAEHPEMQNLLRDMSYAVCASLKGIEPSHRLFPKLLAEKGIELFEANFNAILAQIRILDPAFNVACAAGCSYCCSSHITLMPQEAFNIALHMARNFPEDIFEELSGLCCGIASELEKMSLAEFAGKYFRSCPLLVDDKCSIYDVRPVLARNWISTDLKACIASYESGNTITVPQNSLIMVQKELIYAGAAAYLDGFGINGQICSFIPLLAAAMTDFEGTYSRWLAGERLPGQFELK